MKINQLYTYPIKSLRGCPLSSVPLTSTGFPHDRRFMLLKIVKDDSGTESLKNMHVPHFPEMALFSTAIEFPSESGSGQKSSEGKVIVTYTPPGTSESSPEARRLEIPLVLDVRGLDELAIVMHRSATKGYSMGGVYNEWFSECFGYPVVLAYLGPNLRRVLGSFPPGKSMAHKEEYNRSMKSNLVSVGLMVAGIALVMGLIWLGLRGEGRESRQSLISLALGVILLFIIFRAYHSGERKGKRDEERITFADTAPYLVASETSLHNVSDRLPEDEQMDMTKFRPNIVVSGAEEAFEEDFWAELTIGDESARLLLTANCVRCQSINVDYATGKMGTGESGSVLKKLMKDRRVDKGAKWSPVFGRYSFLDEESENAVIRVGDEVSVARRVDERTVYDWPGLG